MPLKAGVVNSSTTSATSPGRSTAGKKSAPKAASRAALDAALVRAAVRGDMGTAKVLLAKGADPNARGEDGVTPPVCGGFLGKRDGSLPAAAGKGRPAGRGG